MRHRNTPRSPRHRNGGDTSQSWPAGLRSILQGMMQLATAAQIIENGGGEGDPNLGIVLKALGGDTGEGLLFDTEIALPFDPSAVQDIDELHETLFDSLLDEYGDDAPLAWEQYQRGEAHIAYFINLQTLNRHFSRGGWSVMDAPASIGLISGEGYWLNQSNEESISVPIRWSGARVCPHGCGGRESQPLDRNGLCWAMGCCLDGGLTHLN